MTRTPKTKPSNQRQKALLYCRVSDPKQKHDGHGLESQEQRIRQFAEFHQFEVEQVFHDDVTGGGDFNKRPAMTRLLDYLKAHRKTNYVVVFDDIKRFSRDVYFYWGLIRELDKYDAQPMSPNFVFEQTPEGRFQQSITVAAGEYERESNARQCRQKTLARLEAGYYAFIAPVGFKYHKERGQPKAFVRDEPVASVIEEMMRGFLSGRFQTQTECRRFLEHSPLFPKGKSGKVGNDCVNKLLTNPLYAGMIEHKGWGVSLRKGQHTGMVSYEDFLNIQERMKKCTHAPSRQDLHLLFPLRGAISCECGNSLTSASSRSQTGKYHPYYLCQNRKCQYKGKSIRKDVLEGEFEKLLKSLSLGELKGVAEKMFKQLWKQQQKSHAAQKEVIKQEYQNVDKEIQKLLDKIVETSSTTVQQKLESRIDELEQQKLLLEDKMEKTGRPTKTYDGMYRTAMDFLLNPHKYWTYGDFTQKRTVLKLVFADRLTWVRNGVYRTPNLSLPFKVLDTYFKDKNGMVEMAGFEPASANPPLGDLHA